MSGYPQQTKENMQTYASSGTDIPEAALKKMMEFMTAAMEKQQNASDRYSNSNRPKNFENSSHLDEKSRG